MKIRSTVGLAMLAVLAFAFGEACADSYELIGPEGITTSLGGYMQANRTPEYCLNGAGMNANGTHQSDTANAKMWMVGGTTASVAIGLPEGSDFLRLKIYNCNWKNYTNRGARQFEVWVGETKPAAIADVKEPAYRKLDLGVTELQQAVNYDTYYGETFDLPSRIFETNVIIKITSNWGGNYTSLSEVQFFQRVVADGAADLPVTELVETASSLSVTGLVEKAAATVGFYAVGAKKGGTYRVTLPDPVAKDAGFSIPVDVSGWTQFDTYTFYCFAENESGATTNRVGTYYAASVPTDKNVWMPVDGDTSASTAANWSQKTVPDGSLPIMLNGAFGDGDIVWTSGVNGLVANLPVVYCDGFTKTFTLDGGLATSFSQGSEPFAVGHFTLGSTAPAALTLNAGAYDFGENVTFGAASAAAHSSLTVGANAALKAKNLTLGHSFSLETSAAGSVEVAATLTMGANTGDAEPVGSEVTVRGALTSGALAASAGNRFVIDGGVVTNKGDSSLFGSGVGTGALIVRNGGKLVQQNYFNINSNGEMSRFEILDGASYVGLSTTRACGDITASGRALFVISNATYQSTELYFPRGINASNCTLIIHADEGRSASFKATTSSSYGTLALGAWGQKGNVVRVENATATISGPLRIGGYNQGTIAVDQTNRFYIAGKAAKVSTVSLEVLNDSRIVFTLPPTPFDTTPLTITGSNLDSSKFDANAGIDIDVRAARPGATYTLFAAKNHDVSGLTKDQIRIIGAGNCEIKLTSRQLTIRKKPGLVIMFR